MIDALAILLAAERTADIAQSARPVRQPAPFGPRRPK
jgi:hypothetical protein